MSSNNNYKDNNKYEMPPELLENAKDVIIDYVKNGYPNGTTFAELENELTEKGLVVLNKNKRPENGEPCATALDMPSNDKISNVVIWNTKNDLLAEACTSLLNEKDRIWLMPTHELNYAMEGQLLAIPVATKAAHYKVPHWYPTVLVYGKEKYETLRQSNPAYNRKRRKK